MREKHVPVRVGKELKESQGVSPMMDAQTELKLKGELLDDLENVVEYSTSQDGNIHIASKDLPSMVSIVALNAPHVYELNNTELCQQQTFLLRSTYDNGDHFKFLDHASVSESQRQSVKFGVRVFRDWLLRQGSTFKRLEEMSRQEIANALEQFYLTARRPNGTQYKKNTLRSIKHSLDLYLRNSPLKKDFSISTDFDFREVNRTLEKLPDDAENNRFPQCTMDTILKLYKSGQLGLVTTEDPQVLIQTVWFYIVCYFFTNVDKRMLRQLTDSMLVLEKDDNGTEYYRLDFRMPEGCRSDQIYKTRLYAKPGSLCCPVAMIKKYLEHRNPRNDVFFQHPKKVTVSDRIWYSPLPFGKNKHMDIIRAMCVSAGIDPPLTGRCIRDYVQNLLRDCDQAVNNMFHLVRSTPALQAVILPKVTDGNTNHFNGMSQIFSSTGIPKIGISSQVGTMRPTTPLQTITVPRHQVPQLSLPTTTGIRMISSSPTCSSACTATSSGMQMMPHQSNFSALNGIGRLASAQNQIPSSQQLTLGSSAVPNMSPTVPTWLVTSGGHLPTGHVTMPTGYVTMPTGQVTMPAGHVTMPTGQVTMPTGHVATATKKHALSVVDTCTQTEATSQSAYDKADLKTRNKMRLQARKALLSFLEELNEISDGHGIELFHEIIQEDMNMWKAVAGSNQ